ncbi:molybdopterin-dependent oxidoreductase [Bordetella genomosp. 5]|uniref:Aspartyl/glutamyl-tRNA(Asn/Gln) amidotransferase subunit C n=1 Tax=Bordetella genomosp. 5 TaxID=1395608 RepID=A0A261TSJ6_9BORD|nr:molybdopterin-dependent oxidoreductase [Bordetella genomosp. 5]OZI52251.1 aspartyl/glutamyl-tRNA(Asn/Gln) amidotransferase subunit C [Bordetella genomosp. 5]
MSRLRSPSLAHWGAFTAVTENGRLVACEPFGPDPEPSAMLASIPEMVHSPLRIRRPAVRKGWLDGNRERENDEYIEVSWERALALVADELARVRAAHGPAGIFGGSYGWSSAGRVHHARSLIRRFLFQGGGCVDQIGNYSWGAAQFLLPHVIGGTSPVSGDVTDWDSVLGNTRLIVAFGGIPVKNSQVTSGGAGLHNLSGWLQEAQARGIRLVAITPTRADIPEGSNADWIAIRPNTDTALMLAMAHTLIAEGRHDAAFVATHCTGFERWAAYLRGETDGQAKNAAWAAAITGVPADTIRALARDLATQRSLLTAAWSLQRAQYGEQPYWAMIALAALVGQIGLPGGGFAFGHASLNGVGQPRRLVPGPEVPVPRNPAQLAIPVARITDMLLAPGAEYEFNGEHHAYPDIKLIYWAGGNPFHHHQDQNRLRSAWRTPETVIVHESWWTPLARRADIVLPVTTPLERADVGGSSRDPYVFAMHPAIAPQGEARNDFDIFAELARRAGFYEAYTAGRDIDGWCRHVYEGMRGGCAERGVTLPPFDEFWARGYAEVPPPERPYVLYENFRQDPAAHRLRTPSGRIELYSEVVAGFGYDDCPGHPAWLAPTEWLGAPAARDWPLHLLTNQPRTRLHSQLDPASLSRAGKVAGHEPVALNPDDAAERGIRAGDVVRLYNARGACLAGAVLDPGLLRGVVIMATGAWSDPDGDLDRHGNPNTLTADVGTSRLTQGPSAQTALVQAERYAGPAVGHRAWEAPVLRPA